MTFEGDNCRAAEAPLPPTATARAADEGDGDGGDGADGADDDTGERDCVGDVPRTPRDGDGLLLLLLAVGDDDDHGLSYERGGKADGGSRPKLLPPPPLLPSAWLLPGLLEAGRERLSSKSTDSERWASCHRSRLAFECRSVCRAKAAVGGDLRDTTKQRRREVTRPLVTTALGRAPCLRSIRRHG